MKGKKRTKMSRYRGGRTHSRGKKNRTRGSGNRGGVGMAGTGKRSHHRKSLMMNLYGSDYFGKKPQGMGLREKNKIQVISLRAIGENLPGMVKKGEAKEEKGHYVINLKDYKIIGNHKIGAKVTIHAKMATAGALEAVKKEGGEIVVEASS